jgi:hypothetical protein
MEYQAGKSFRTSEIRNAPYILGFPVPQTLELFLLFVKNFFQPTGYNSQNSR